MIVGGTNHSEARLLPAILDGRRVGIGFKTSPQFVGWSELDRLWATAGELDVFGSGWMNDHLWAPGLAEGGSSFESLSAAAALAHRVPGKWIGNIVLSNTFRHPAVLAKTATVLDHVTGGRFVVGLGAGWHVGEHTAFGLDLPPIGDRIDRLRSATKVLKALFSPEASGPPGVTLEDEHFPLAGATNEPYPVQPGGPRVWLAGQKPRGIEIAAALADGWIVAAERFGDPAYFTARRDDLLRRLEAHGRDPSSFAFVATVRGDGSRRERKAAAEAAIELVRCGATHVVVVMTASGGPEVLRRAAASVAEPLRDTVG